MRDGCRRAEPRGADSEACPQLGFAPAIFPRSTGRACGERLRQSPSVKWSRRRHNRCQSRGLVPVSTIPANYGHAVRWSPVTSNRDDRFLPSCPQVQSYLSLTPSQAEITRSDSKLRAFGRRLTGSPAINGRRLSRTIPQCGWRSRLGSASPCRRPYADAGLGIRPRKQDAGKPESWSSLFRASSVHMNIVRANRGGGFRHEDKRSPLLPAPAHSTGTEKACLGRHGPDAGSNHTRMKREPCGPRQRPMPCTAKISGYQPRRGERVLLRPAPRRRGAEEAPRRLEPLLITPSNREPHRVSLNHKMLWGRKAVDSNQHLFFAACP